MRAYATGRVMERREEILRKAEEQDEKIETWIDVIVPSLLDAGHRTNGS